MSEIQEIITLTKRLNKCRDAYYNDSKPLISDQEYDDLVEKLKNMEIKSEFYLQNSPNHSVGYKVNSKLDKVKHDIPLLSLDKTKDRNIASNFTHGKEYLLMFKLDGLTICITYDNGKFVEASTRGNGYEGSLITDNVKTFINVPAQINYKGRLKLVGEGIIFRDDFEKINSVLPEDEKYKTPRNLASGSVLQLDSSICAKRMLNFFCFDVLIGFEKENSLENKLNEVSKLGFDVCPFRKTPEETNIDVFNYHVDSLLYHAKKEYFPIDGLVIKYDDIEYGNSLGKTKHHYKNGLALKFNEEQEETTLRNIEWQVGRTGRITPVAVFDPVILDGTTVEKASLHNISIIEKLNVKPLSTVTVVKKNEIIPQIIESCGGAAYDFEIPQTCPICGGKTKIVENDGTKTLQCTNENCDAKILRNIAYFCGKDGMNIDGLSEKTLEKFIDYGFISHIKDIYKLEEYSLEIRNMEGFGEKSYIKLINAIEKSRKVKLENFITALGIPNVALAKAKIISSEFDGDWNKFKSAIKNHFDFTLLNTFGSEINSSIYNYFENNDWVFNFVVEEMFEFIKEENNNKNVFKDMTFVITGKVNLFKNRKEIQDKIESLGGKVSSSVSAKTNYLINNDKESNSIKNRNAKDLGVKIITEEEFIKLYEVL